MAFRFRARGLRFQPLDDGLLEVMDPAVIRRTYGFGAFQRVQLEDLCTSEILFASRAGGATQRMKSMLYVTVRTCHSI